jgi:peptidylprolyl isomerase
MPIGSRVLVELPSQTDPTTKTVTPAAFAVIDVLNAFPAPKQAPASPTPTPSS